MRRVAPFAPAPPVVSLLASSLLALLPLAGARAQGIDLSHGGSVEVTASDGMEWRQNEQVVIARGQARAVRGDVTVLADRLIARYRKKAGAGEAQTASASAPNPASSGLAGTGDGGGNEIYRLEAEGNVRVFTATDMATGDRAIYDIDQAVLVLTGKDLRLTTPQQVMTARDTMEYWSQKRMAVGRGEATITTNDGRRLAADTLVGYLSNPAPGGPQGGTRSTPVPAGAAKPAAGGNALAASGKLQRVEGFGNVEVRTATETIRAARGVYVPDTGVARLVGGVRITRGQNQLNGDEAVVNMRTGVSTLSRVPGGRVQGLVVPNDPANKAEPGTSARPPATPPRPAPGAAPTPPSGPPAGAGGRS